MGKILTGHNNCDIFDEILSENESIINGVIDFNRKKSKQNNTLSSCVKYMDSAIENENAIGISFGFHNIKFNEELSNTKIRYITTELAKAIDNNSVDDVRKIKKEYGNTKEFAKAKDFLNKKCKDVWNVFDNKNNRLKIPAEAMKTLGITNQPSLDFLLNDSLRFYEKDNGTTTVDIINSILDNINIYYTFSDIYSYLKISNKKNNYKLNFKTTKYFIKKLDFDEKKLLDLGIKQETISQALNNLSVLDKLKYLFKNKVCCKLNIS